MPYTGGVLARVRDLVASRIVEGHVTTSAPDICFYRFAKPTTVRKSATFGVTLNVVLEGQKRIDVEGHEIHIDPSRLLVVTRETDTTTQACSAPFLSMSLLFSPDQVAKALLALTDAGVTTAPETAPAFVMPTEAAIADALERLVRTLDDPLDRKLIAPLVIEEILFRLLRSDSAAAVRSAVARTPDAIRILESMRYIRENHRRKLTVEAIARNAGMSASHFAHRFSSVARVTPMRFLREVRLERARSLLFEAGSRANEVASDVGFESAAHFTREFKRRYGVPPSHYLRTRPT